MRYICNGLYSKNGRRRNRLMQFCSISKDNRTISNDEVQQSYSKNNFVSDFCLVTEDNRT